MFYKMYRQFEKSQSLCLEIINFLYHNSGPVTMKNVAQLIGIIFNALFEPHQSVKRLPSFFYKY